MSDRTAARGTIQQLIARACFMVSGFVITVILARELGPAAYAAYGLVMSVLLWVELGATAGIPGALSRLLPEYERRQAAEFENTALLVLLVTSLLILGVGWMLAPFLAELFKLPEEGTVLFRVAFLDIPIYALYIGFQGMLNGYRRYGGVALAIIAYSLTKLVGIVVLWQFLDLTVTGALVVNVLASAGGLAYLLFTSPPRLVRPERALLRPILQAALPLGLILAARQVLLSLDLWSLKALGGGAATVGMYIAAGNLPKMLLVVPNTIGNVLFSSLARALTNGNEPLARTYIQATTRFVLLVLAPCCAIIAQHAEQVMALIYSSAYTGGAPFLRLQLLAAMLQALFAVVLEVLSAAGHYARSVAILLALLPLAVAFNVILIPRFGGLGAASALVFINALGLAVTIAFVHRRYGAMIAPLTLLRIVAATAIIWFLGGWLQVDGLLPMVLEFAALFGVYVLLLGVFRELRWQDLHGFAVWRKSS